MTTRLAAPRSFVLRGVFFFALLSLVTVCRADAPTALLSARVAGVPVTFIAVRLKDPRIVVRPEVCQNFPGGDEPFGAMLQRLRPLAAVNGSYFSKQTKCPIGDIVRNGRLLHSGRMGTALMIDGEGNAKIARVTWGHAADWTGWQTVLACGPALVLDGEVNVTPETEGFHDPHIMGATPRMAVGYTRDNHLIFAKMTGGVTFAREALVMKQLGCVGAMNLDAGASLALFYRGKTLATPGRRLTNLLCIYERP